MNQEYMLEFQDISKEYYGNKVLKNVTLKVKPGEIHSLVGENGAGKSTLMNILFGMEVIHNTGGFSGKVKFSGKDEKINSPKEAMKLGIGMVHQEFMLIPGFTITENIKLNREITKNNLFSKVFGERLKTIDFEKMGKDSRKALDKLDMDISEWIHIAGLPVGHMQFVEIARELDKLNIKLLVFDEPTAVLTESEADHLLKCMRKLANEGISILFITHRLDEVIKISDTITVLRDGELVNTVKTSNTDVGEIAELMIGRKINFADKDKSKNYNEEEIALQLKDFKVDMPGEKVKGINLEIKKGEIFGIGGLAGQGKIGIANGVLGLYPSQGDVYLYGEKLHTNEIVEVLKNHIAFVSEDRRGVGLIIDDSIDTNITFTAMSIQNNFIKKYGFLKIKDTRKIRDHTKKMIKDLDIRCTGPKQFVGSLSGGNQQKVCIARALTQEPEMLFVSEPTRGIDIGAKKLVLDLLLKLNEELNMTIIMTSSELAELRTICDRIAIINDGKLMGVLKPTDDDKTFGLLMSGTVVNKSERREE